MLRKDKPMKLSNFLLSIITSATLGIAISCTLLVMPTEPTAVISIPAEDGMVGNGFSMNFPKNLNDKQVRLLGMAYDIARHDGHKYPQLLQGIILQESRAGDIASYKVAGQEFGLKPNERYYGVAQIKLAAARDVLSRYPSLKDEFDFHTNTDEEVIAKLIENDRFNLSVASKYLLVLKTYGYDTIKQLALAYNQGAGGAKDKDANTHHYSTGVMANIQRLTAKKQ